MPAKPLSLRTLPERLAICSLPAAAALPGWAIAGRFCSITRTPDELSIVCPAENAPAHVGSVGPWACLQVEGVLDFGLTGILAGLASSLAAAGINLFAISTFRTDYILVREEDLSRTQDALRGAGYAVR